MKDFRTYFTISGLVTSLVLGLAPSFWDSLSDFLFAHEEEKLNHNTTSNTSLGLSWPLLYEQDPVPTSSLLTYFFISLPGHLSAASELHRLLRKVCCNCSQKKCCKWPARAARGIANLLFLAAPNFAVVFLFLCFPSYFFYSAVLSTIMVLGIKVLALFVHGPEMKKLSTRATAAESQGESSLQVLLVALIALRTQKVSASSASSIFSSILMISKSGAESYLTFGEENKMEKCGRGFRGLLNKLKLLATYSPVFLATAVFRLSTLVVVFAWDYLFGFCFLLPLTLGLPSLLLLFLKICKLKDLSVVEIFDGVMGEMITHTLWGGRGREGSKKIQLFMTVYLVLFNTIYLLFTFFNIRMDQRPTVVDCDLVPIMCQASIREPAAISCIVLGWLPRVVLSYHLFEVESDYLTQKEKKHSAGCIDYVFVLKTTL